MWCILELNLSIIGGSMATIKPFLRIAIPRMFSSAYGTSGNTGPGIHLESKDRTGFQRSTGINSKAPQISMHAYAESSEELVA